MKISNFTCLGYCLLSLLITRDAVCKSTGASAASGSPTATSTAAPAPAGSGSTAAIESQMLAYGAIDHLSQTIAESVCQTEPNKLPTGATIIIFDQAAFSSIQSYSALIANAELIIGAYNTLMLDHDDSNHAMESLWKERASREEREVHSFEQLRQDKETSTNARDKNNLSDSALLIRKSDQIRSQKIAESLATQVSGTSTPPPYVVTLPVVTPLLSAIAVSSNSETPGSISIPDSALALAVTRAVRLTCSSRNLTLIYPPLFGVGSASDVASSHIALLVKSVQLARKQAHDDAESKNKTFLGEQGQNEEDILKNGSGTTTQITTKKINPAASGNAILVAAIADIDALYDGFMNTLIQANSTTGLPGSVSVIQGYELASLLAGSGEAVNPTVPPGYVLLASVIAAGGTEHVHKTFWTALTTGDQITYSGGAVVNFALWSGDKSPLLQQVLRYKTPFMDIKSPCGIASVDSGDNLQAKDIIHACGK